MTIRHQQMTARLMARYGGNATLTRSTPGVGGQPWDPVEPILTHFTVQVIETGVELDLQPGSLIHAGDLVAVMLPHADLAPKQVDGLTVGGTTYTILSVHPVRAKPEGPVIHYVLHGRA